MADVPWGWIAFTVAVLSAAGYALQTILDYVAVSSELKRLVFFGFFKWDGILALLTGIIAVLIGRDRGDWTRRLGLVAIGYVVFAQTMQLAWDRA